MARPCEPGGDIPRVAVEVLAAVRVGDDVNNLRQVDHHQPARVDEQVVGGQVAVRETGAGESRHGLDELAPETGELGRPGAGLGEPGCTSAVCLTDELQQDLSPQDLYRIGDRYSRVVQLDEGIELGVRPLSGDRLAAEVAAVRDRAVDPALADAAAFQVPGIPVKLPVRRLAVPLSCEQAGPVGAGHAPADEVDVGFLAGFQDAELGVDGGELGDQPPRMRSRAAFGRGGLVPGGPAVTLRQAVGRVARVISGQAPHMPVTLGEGLLVVVLLTLPLATGAADPVDMAVGRVG